MIVIARHGRPALDRHVWINAEQYQDWWAQYDAGGLTAGQKVPNALMQALMACKIVVSSSLRRALETAELAAPGRDLIIDPRFVEAPLPPPPLPSFILFKPRFWGIISRIGWFLGYHRDQESRAEAEIRAQGAADWLIEQAQTFGSVGLLAHGWFNRMMRPYLIARGWVCVYDGRDAHWSHRIYRPKPD
ncbi:histidine phosphatase family protein [Candidatus Phycosocius spiralis]|nr:histidine phosphatase family protein [Candidatus Phycosocius spiralis]